MNTHQSQAAPQKMPESQPHAEPTDAGRAVPAGHPDAEYINLRSLQQRYGQRAVMRMMAQQPPQNTVQPLFGEIGQSIGGAIGGETGEAIGGALGGAADRTADAVAGGARAAFEAACRAAGVSPDAVMAFIDRAGDAAEAIYQDPVGFANNLINALRRGFSQFFGNLADHLLGGLGAWLGEQFGNIGIDLPADFSLEAVFQVVLQVLGITVDRIRDFIIHRFGRGVLRQLERTYGWLRDTAGNIGDLFEIAGEGLSAILSDIRDQIMAFVTGLIQPALARILSMFNPVGALVQAIMAISRVLEYLQTTFGQVAGFLETVLSSAASIASGALDAVASAIERTLAAAIPQVLNVLVNLLGLTNIASRIADMIRRIEGLVERVLDRIVRALMRGIGGGDDAGDDAPTVGGGIGQYVPTGRSSATVDLP